MSRTAVACHTIRHVAGLFLCGVAFHELFTHPVEDVGSHMIALGLMFLAAFVGLDDGLSA